MSSSGLSAQGKATEGHGDVLRAGKLLGGLFSLERRRLQGELEPFPAPKGTPREMDFGQGPGGTQGKWLPEGKYGILGRSSSL